MISAYIFTTSFLFVCGIYHIFTFRAFFGLIFGFTMYIVRLGKAISVGV
jgi:hypothetical protein